MERAAANGVPIRHLMSGVRQALNDGRTTALRNFLAAMATNSIEAPSDVISECENVMQQLWDHPDSGVHAAWEILTNTWNIEPPSDPATEDYAGSRSWRTTANGQRMIRIEPVAAFGMGSNDHERKAFGVAHLDRLDDGEVWHERKIPRNYEIAAHEVTVAQYQEFLETLRQDVDAMLEKAEQAEPPNDDRIGLLEGIWSHVDGQLHNMERNPPDSPQQPSTKANWYDAVAFCVWKSNAADLPSCYGDILEVYNAFQRMTPVAVDRSIPGYRLPSEAEWEYACRAGSITPWYFGRDPSLIDSYAISATNSGDILLPVGTRKPNRWGLFDMLGNAQEWTDSPVQAYPRTSETFADPIHVNTAIQNVIARGGDYTQNDRSVRSSWRGNYGRSLSSSELGFRLVRTLPNGSD